LYLDAAEASRIATAFPLSLDGIDRAIRLTKLTTSSDATFPSQAAALSAACRKVASPDLPRFARRLQPVFGLNDVVLPPDRLQQLREIVAHVKLATHVLNTWGFSGQLPYGRGVAALFSGPSGTGKTMAAQAIARELGTETFVIDLSQVFSKYIGETEKFIDATFRDAQRAGAVLQIDEAEALFGRRSEVKDSHDRYANVEVAYLLQRMEAFDGIAILTTNLQQNVDQAFLRRLRFVIDFPKPDVNAREKIWRQCLPKNAPANRLDFRYLARRLELTGGCIRQVTIRAAFLAASEGSHTIEMSHIVDATRSELNKLGMVTAEREFAEWGAAYAA
jgi:SpoVK/Ycf46/Vps4 family AAA+-type ATPase